MSSCSAVSSTVAVAISSRFRSSCFHSFITARDETDVQFLKLTPFVVGRSLAALWDRCSLLCNLSCNKTIPETAVNQRTEEERKIIGPSSTREQETRLQNTERVSEKSNLSLKVPRILPNKKPRTFERFDNNVVSYYRYTGGGGVYTSIPGIIATTTTQKYTVDYNK